MSTNNLEVLIIGGGLTGLTIAYLLKQQNISATIIEARERLGGRIHTKYSKAYAPLEMGATWFGKKHRQLLLLLEELNIEYFEQALGTTAIYEPISTSPPQLVQLPPNNDPSFRIKNGSSTLIKTLASHLNKEQIINGQAVKSIRKEENFILVKTDTEQYKAKIVISTLPPFLLQQSISVSPSLPASFTDLAKQTHTWMGESIKIALTYQHPFWRAKNTSGTIFSSVGPISEFYDHSNVEDNRFALKGFINGAYAAATKEQRLKVILQQLSKYYGAEASNYSSYEETVWRHQAYTFSTYPSSILPHQNNGHALFRKAYLDGQFFIAGAETAPSFPGYMDGAIESAYFVCQQLEEVLKDLT